MREKEARSGQRKEEDGEERREKREEEGVRKERDRCLGGRMEEDGRR